MNDIDPITCAHALSRLDEWLDRELGPDEVARVERHLETCARCAREFHFEAAVVGAVRVKLRRIRVPFELLARISARLEQCTEADGTRGG